jgi:hypothetical protein
MQLPQFAENNDWRVIAAGLLAEIVRRRARGRQVAIRIEQDEVGSRGVGELEGLLGAIGFDRRGAAKFEEHSQHFARLARGVDNQHAGREFHATGLRADSKRALVPFAWCTVSVG